MTPTSPAGTRRLNSGREPMAGVAQKPSDWLVFITPGSAPTESPWNVCYPGGHLPYLILLYTARHDQPGDSIFLWVDFLPSRHCDYLFLNFNVYQFMYLYPFKKYDSYNFTHGMLSCFPFCCFFFDIYYFSVCKAPHEPDVQIHKL